MGLGALIGGGSNSSIYDYLTIANSRKFSYEIIKKFDLINVFEIVEKDSLVLKEKMFNLLNNSIKKIWVDPETSLTYLTINTQDKYLSAEIANYYIERLDYYNLHIKKNKHTLFREFLENQVNESKSKIDSLSNEMVKFQVENNLIDIDAQVEKTFGIYSDLLNQKLKQVIDFELSEIFGNSEFGKIQIEEKIKLFDQMLDNLKSNSDYDYLLPIKDIPELSKKYLKLLMELTIQKEFLKVIYPQFAKSKMDEFNNLPTIEVFEKAEPAGFRTKPKRAILCIVSFISAFLISSFFVILFSLLSEKKIEKFKFLIKIISSK